MVEAAVLDRLRDDLATLGAAHELVDVDGDHAVEAAHAGGEVFEVEHARDVAAAPAQKDAGPHCWSPAGFGPAASPAAVTPTLRRAPMRASSGSMSWE